MKNTTAQIALLKFLAVQAQTAALYVGYTAYLVIGYAGCHKLTGEALIRRGLVDVAVVGSQTRITINARGRDVLVQHALATGTA